MLEKPRFLQGVFSFEGKGLATPLPMNPAVGFTVSTDKRCQLTYFRAGNASSELIYFVVTRDGAPMRYFPVGAKSSVHVPLAVVEDLHPDTRIEVHIAAPQGLAGQALIDVGFMEF